MAKIPGNTYHQSWWGRLVLLSVFLLVLKLTVHSFTNKEMIGFIFGLVATPILGYYFLAFGIFLKITISQDGIRVNARKLIRSRELLWKEIDHMMDDSFLGIHFYHLIPKTADKRRITVSCSIANYKELLARITLNAHNAVIDNSVNVLLVKKSPS